MSVTRRRCAAGCGRRSMLCALGLVLAAGAVLFAPLLAVACVFGDDGGCLCQSPQPPGDPLTVAVLLDASHGWALGGGPSGLTVGHRAETVVCSALRPPGCLFALACDGRPPPPDA